MIKVRQLKHKWPGQEEWILKLSNLEIRSGEKVAIIGGSGRGKSTLLAILSGLLKPTEGEVWINGLALHEASSHDRAHFRATTLGWQGESTPLLLSHSAIENLTLSAQSLNGSPPQRSLEESAKVISQLLNPFGVSLTLAHKKPSELSLGERQRFEVLKTCVSGHPLLFFDEPTSHLDRTRSLALGEALLNAIHKTQTALIVTHDLALAARCDRVINLDHPLANKIELETELETEPETELDVDRKEETQLLYDLTRTYSSPWRFALRLLLTDLKLYTTIAIASLIALLIPLILEVSIERAQEHVFDRAQNTPLIVGAINGEQQLFFSSLYFTSAPLNSLDLSQAEDILGMGLGEGSPIVIAPRVEGHPLVGTDASYHRLRGFHFLKGRSAHSVGEVCISDTLATHLGLTLGAHLQTEMGEIFNLTSPYPIELEVVGLFKSKDGSDDHTIFTTLATAWAALGYVHSHSDTSGPVDSSLPIDQKLERSRIHLHSSPERLPISALLMHSKNPRDQSLLKARLRRKNDQFLVIKPQEVASDTLQVVKVFKGVLKPLVNALALVIIILILLMLAQRHISLNKFRVTLEAMGLNAKQRQLLSIREYSLFLLGLLLCFTLLWMSLEYIALSKVMNFALSLMN